MTNKVDAPGIYRLRVLSCGVQQSAQRPNMWRHVTVVRLLDRGLSSTVLSERCSPAQEPLFQEGDEVYLLRRQVPTTSGRTFLTQEFYHLADGAPWSVRVQPEAIIL